LWKGQEVHWGILKESRNWGKSRERLTSHPTRSFNGDPKDREEFMGRQKTRRKGKVRRSGDGQEEDTSVLVEKQEPSSPLAAFEELILSALITGNVGRFTCLTEKKVNKTFHKHIHYICDR